VQNVAGLPGAAKLRVATYNVLAEIYATQQMYPYCDHWALSWNYRKVGVGGGGVGGKGCVGLVGEGAWGVVSLAWVCLEG
jgi:hypothetical protein